MAQVLNIANADFERGVADLLAMTRGGGDDVSGAVGEIIRDVRADGLAAVSRLTRQFDEFDLNAETLAFTEADIDAAMDAVDPEIIKALEVAAARIRAYHEKQRPDDLSYTDEAGVRLGWRWSAVDAAGLYAPGGRAAYPSSVLMNAIPAKVAGVTRLAMVTPTPGGEGNPAVLAAARIAGVTEIYRIGGAQAIAALAFGADAIAPVDVIVGPGNAYVAEDNRRW